jgi:hypothetical protein
VAALTAWRSALDGCRAAGLHEAAHLCQAQAATSLRLTGCWSAAVRLCRGVLAAAAPQPARMLAGVELGLVLAARGQVAAARQPLDTALGYAEAHGMGRLRSDAAWGLARVAALEGDGPAAVRWLDTVVTGAQRSPDSAHPVPGLRWAGAFFARRGMAGPAAVCAAVLRQITVATGSPHARAALHCLAAEQALLRSDTTAAAEGFEAALRLLLPLDLPVEAAEVQVRCGVALAAAGQHRHAVARLAAGHRTAEAVGAAPLAAAAERELAGLRIAA